MDNYEGNISKRILVIHDSLEVVRQPHAEIEEFMERIFGKIFLDKPYIMEFTHGKKAEELLSNLRNLSFELILFASNAIIRKDGSIYKILNEKPEEIRNFIKSGRSIIIFHQGFSGQSSEVEFLKFMESGKWVSVSEPVLETVERDPILSYPNQIPKESFVTKSTKAGFPVCYIGISPEEIEKTGKEKASENSIRDVLYTSSPKKVSILRTYEEKGRLILCSYPADWIKDVDFMENVVYYAINGKPKVVMVNYPKLTAKNNEYYNMLRVRLQSVSKLSMYNHIENFNLDKDFLYLLKYAEIFLFPSEDLRNFYLQDIEVKKAVTEKGLMFIVAEQNEDMVENLVMTIGKKAQSHNKFLFDYILSELENREWFQGALLHDLKDFILALMDVGETGIAEKYAKPVYDRVCHWLEKDSIEEDPVTALQALWLYKAILYQGGMDERANLKNKIEEGIRLLQKDERCNDFHELICFLSKPVSVPIDFPSSSMTQSQLTFGQIIRRIDTIYMLHFVGAEVKISESFYETVLNNVKKFYIEKKDFFEISDATIPTMASIIRFLFEVPYTMTLKQSVNSLLNELVNLFIKNKRIFMSEDEEQDGTDISLADLISYGIMIKMENYYPKELFEILIDLDSFSGKTNRSSDKDKTIIKVNKRIEKRDEQIRNLKEREEELRESLIKRMKSLRILSYTGSFFFNVVALISVFGVLGILLMIFDASVKGKNISELLGILFSVLPLVGAYFTFLFTKKLYKVDINFNDIFEKKIEGNSIEDEKMKE